jgi:hypothetical protein
MYSCYIVVVCDFRCRPDFDKAELLTEENTLINLERRLQLRYRGPRNLRKPGQIISDPQDVYGGTKGRSP